ncbi:hypothetical protein [Jongsikchunia kroppenstedtii]|uniref:hypothetical protein n=1 Tax=Jongsikchunia kroppenstedtii TaxID=1121721 RepID=UPI0003A9921C|nr:hypothetical protein [Jongsikchunia kroppenstedtii]
MRVRAGLLAAAVAALIAVVVVVLVITLQSPALHARADTAPAVPVGGTYVPSLANRPSAKWTKTTAELFGKQVAATPGTLSVAGSDPPTIVVSYVQPGHSYVMAADAATGQARWTKPTEITGVEGCDFSQLGELMCYSPRLQAPNPDPTGVDVSMVRRHDGSIAKAFSLAGNGKVTESAVGDGFVFTFSGPTASTYVSVSSTGATHWSTTGVGGKEERMAYSPITDLVAIRLDAKTSTVLSQRRNGRIFTASNEGAPGYGGDDDIALNAFGFSVNEPSGLGVYDRDARRVGSVAGAANLVASDLHSGSALSGATTCPRVPFVEMDYSGRGQLMGEVGVADATNGKVLWQNSRSGFPLDMTCVGTYAVTTGMRSLTDTRLVITNYDLESGRQESTYEFPTVGVIAAGFDAEGNATYASAVEGSEKAIAAASYNLGTGTQQWQMTLSDVYWSPTLGNSFWSTTAGFFYVGTNSSLVRLAGA